MLEPGNEPRLTLEPLPKPLVVKDGRANHLDGHVPVHAGLIGAEHGGHPASADLFGDLVGAQLLPDHRGGVLGMG